MDKITKNRWQIRLAAVLIFLLGFVAGALAPRTYRVWLRPSSQTFGADRYTQMLDQLHVTAEQKTQVQQIFSDTREQLQALRRESEPRFNEIRQQADERLRKVLTTEQWEQFQQMRSERGRRGRRGNPGNGDGAAPPSPERR